MQGGGAANHGLTNTCAATLRLPCVPRAGLGKPWSASNATNLLHHGSQNRIQKTTGEVHFCAPAFSYVLRTKKGSFFVILFCFNFIGLRLSRPALKPASKLALRCFVLIFMVSRHWSSRLALRPAFNFVSSYKLFVLLQYPST